MRKLEALEDDRYDQLPDAVFARALASSVCRTLKVDPQPVLAAPAADRRAAPGAGPAKASTRRSARPATRPRAGWREYTPASRRLLAVGALLLGAVVILVLPQHCAANRLPSAARPAPRRPKCPWPRRWASATGAPADAAVAPAAASAAPGSMTMTPVAVHPQANAAAAAPAAAPVAATRRQRRCPRRLPAGIVVFRATGPSWIAGRPTASGNVALRRLLAAGEIGRRLRRAAAGRDRRQRQQHRRCRCAASPSTWRRCRATTSPASR